MSGPVIKIAGAVRMVTPELCPLCGVSLVGPEITEANNPLLYPQFTHLSRAGAIGKVLPPTYGVKSETKLVGFMCPDCKGRFKP
jgi:hypothetical protein